MYRLYLFSFQFIGLSFRKNVNVHVSFLVRPNYNFVFFLGQYKCIIIYIFMLFFLCKCLYHLFCRKRYLHVPRYYQNQFHWRNCQMSISLLFAFVNNSLLLRKSSLQKANLDLKIVNLLFRKSKETFKFYQNEIILIYVTNFI